MKPSVPDATLQINLCAGDLAYCDETVPALVTTHRPDVREALVIADCCRPQSTPFHHRPGRSTAAEFRGRVEKLRAVCDTWLAMGLVDRVEYVEPRAGQLRQLNRRNTGRATAWSHDHLGHAFSAYFAGWGEARTRYVLHFDADILLYQAQGYSWVRAAITAMEQDPQILAVSPRIAPPMAGPAGKAMVRIDAPGSGWLPTWRLEGGSAGWTSDWFSTRCHVMDLERYRRALPLTPRRGRMADRLSQWVNVAISPLYESAIWTRPSPSGGGLRLPSRIVRQLAKRVIPAYPLPPEVLLYERARHVGMQSLYLGDERAWYIHPDTKDTPFLTLLPRLLGSTRRGQCPDSQRGVSGIQFDQWARE